MDEGRMPALCKECGEPIATIRSCKSKRAGMCSRCFRRAYDRDYRRAHRDRYRLYAHRYYRSHKEQLKQRNTEQKRSWRESNRARYRAYQRDYKRRARIADAGCNWDDLPVTCAECGADISRKWATKARRAGLCSPCYERRSRNQNYHRAKARQETVAGALRAASEAIGQVPVST